MSEDETTATPPIVHGIEQGETFADRVATNVCENLDGLLIGHDVFGEAWDDAGMESRRTLLCEVAGFVRQELAATPMTAVVRCGGRDLDDLGPPSDGHYYIVLEVPNGHNDLIQAALTTWRIGLVEARS